MLDLFEKFSHAVMAFAGILMSVTVSLVYLGVAGNYDGHPIHIGLLGFLFLLGIGTFVVFSRKLYSWYCFTDDRHDDPADDIRRHLVD
jgi:hypothetical protein